MRNALSKALIFMLGPLCIIDTYTLPYFPQKCKRAHKNSRNLYMEKRPEGVDARLGARNKDYWLTQLYLCFVFSQIFYYAGAGFHANTVPCNIQFNHFSII